MDSVKLSEQLMRRGWWHEAELALDRQDVMPSERLLHGSALILRRECVEYLKAHRDMPIEEMKLRMLRNFDVYTINWTLHDYVGEGSLTCQPENEKANDLTD